MSCRSEDLPLLTTGRLTVLARWRTERHVQRCPTCQEELQALRSLSDSLRTATQAQPSADLDERVLSIRPGAIGKSRPTGPISGGNLMRHPLLLSPLLGVSCAIAVTYFVPPTYSSTGRVLVISPSKDPSTVPTVVELMKGSYVLKDVQQRVVKPADKPLPTFTIEVVDKTPLIEITARGEDPEVVRSSVDSLMAVTQMHAVEEYVLKKKKGRQPNFDAEIRIVKTAETPTTPSTHNRTLALTGGLLAGFLLGGFLTLFRRQG